MSNRQLLRAFFLVYCLKSCSSHANPTLSFVYPEGVAVTCTWCFPGLISLTQELCIVLSLPVKMRPGGRALPSAQTLANSVTHSQFPSCVACLFFCFLYKRLLKILLLLATRLMAKPFLSMLYVLAACTLYSLILLCRRVK